MRDVFLFRQLIGSKYVVTEGTNGGRDMREVSQHNTAQAALDHAHSLSPTVTVLIDPHNTIRTENGGNWYANVSDPDDDQLEGHAEIVRRVNLHEPLQAALNAAKAFIASHAADPDITSEMRWRYARAGAVAPAPEQSNNQGQLRREEKV